MKTEIEKRLEELRSGMSRCLAQAERDRHHEQAQIKIESYEQLECYEVIMSRITESLKRARKLEAAIFELERLLDA